MEAVMEKHRISVSEQRDRSDLKAEQVRNSVDDEFTCSLNERRRSVANFWKVICGLCTVIGIISGFLISDLRFMGTVTENKVGLANLEKRVDNIELVQTQRFNELKLQADTHFNENHALILQLIQKK